MENGIGDSDDGTAFEGQFPRQELVQNDSEREQIAPRVDSGAEELLGRHVIDRAERDAGSRQSSFRRRGVRCVAVECKGTRQSEIGRAS